MKVINHEIETDISILLILKKRTTGKNTTEMFKMETLGKLGLGLGFSKGKEIFTLYLISSFTTFYYQVIYYFKSITY